VLSRTQDGRPRWRERPAAANPFIGKREADVLAVKLFCLFAFILVGLITAGVL
jgi:hypothetical protein